MMLNVALRCGPWQRCRSDCVSHCWLHSELLDVIFFFFHTWLKTAALYHEIIDNTVKNCTVVMTFFDVCYKVKGADGCFDKIKLDDEIAVVGVKCDHYLPFSEQQVESVYRVCILIV